jgi:hypothetical protein
MTRAPVNHTSLHYSLSVTKSHGPYGDATDDAEGTTPHTGASAKPEVS